MPEKARALFACACFSSLFAAAFPVVALAAVAPVADTAVVPGANPTLRIFAQEHPVAFFFRDSDATAARGRISYGEWEAQYSRLLGVMGKMQGEELPVREKTQPFFRRLKAAHPEQAVLMHSSAMFRSPRADNSMFIDGHWLYYNGARVLDAVPADKDVVTIKVAGTKCFHMSPFAVNRTIPDDVGLCALDADGKPDWRRAEQTRLLAIDAKAGTITLQRGLYGSKPRAFEKGGAYAAAHVAQTWGTANKLWLINMSTAGPRDVRGRTAGEVWAGALIASMRPGGGVDYVDGVEFDVPLREPVALGRDRRADCDADGEPDQGIVGGKPVFAIGVDNFFKTLRAALPDRLIMADVGTRAQRSLATLNGVETEGWPRLRDPEFNAWSTALNDHRFWAERAREPRFSYGLLKFRGDDEKNVPFSSVRLALAGPILAGTAVSQGYPTPKGANGIWDELVGGRLAKPGWLGKVRGPPRHLALEQGAAGGSDLLAKVNIETSATVEGGVLLDAGERAGATKIAGAASAGADARVKARAAKPDAEYFAIRVGGVRLAQPADLVVSFEISAESMPGFPPDTYRTAAVTVVPAGGKVRMSAAALAQFPQTPCNAQAFPSVFYFRDVPAGKKDLLIVLEGAPAVTISNLRAHAGADAVVREYERGVILANPSARAYTFDTACLFPGMKLRRLHATEAQDPAANNGKPAEGKITLAPRDALFLLKE